MDRQEGKLMWITDTPPPQDDKMFLAFIMGELHPCLAVWDDTAQEYRCSDTYLKCWGDVPERYFDSRYVHPSKVVAWLPIPEIPKHISTLQPPRALL